MLKSSYSPNFCGIYPIFVDNSSFCAAGFSQSTVISPPSGIKSPVMSLMSVVFPEPSAPINPVIFPFSISSERLSTALIFPKDFVKFNILTVCIITYVNFYRYRHSLTQVLINIIYIDSYSIH